MTLVTHGTARAAETPGANAPHDADKARHPSLATDDVEREAAPALGSKSLLQGGRL